MHYLRQGRGFYRSAIALMLPMILQNLVTNFMALADSFMVGALGETELAAVTMANSVFYVLSLIIFGIQSEMCIRDRLRGAHVEVVRRLVQQEDVRVLKDEPREVHAGLFAAGEQGKLPLPQLGRDIEAVGHAVALMVHVIAAQAAEVVR